MASISLTPSGICVPFRMQPGLQRSTREACALTPLRRDSALYAEKLAVLNAGAARFAIPGFDEVPVLAAIEAHAPAATSDAEPELRFEEDFALIDAQTASIPWMRVCVPSHWAPEDKIGLPLAAIHAPVADNASLIRASDALAQLVCDGHYRERHVWTLSPSGRYDQHPRRQPRVAWPDFTLTQDPATWIEHCWWRVERQTFLPIAGQAQTSASARRQALFAIRVQRLPLKEAVATPEDALRLHEALTTMSDAALDYKGLRAAREPVLRWLQTLRSND